MTSVFEGIDEVQPETPFGSKYAYFEPGDYQVAIKDVFVHKKRLGTGRLFIAETIVKESSNDNITPSEQRNWVVSLELPNSLSRIKTFIAAAYGYDARKDCSIIQKNITREVCDEAVSSKNPMAGKLVALTCTNKITQSKKEFLLHAWSPSKSQYDPTQ